MAVGDVSGGDGENHKVCLILDDTLDMRNKADSLLGGEQFEQADVRVDVYHVIFLSSIVNEHRVVLHGEDIVCGELGSGEAWGGHAGCAGR